MKARITEKQARECVSFAFGYCEIQALLRNWNPVFYTASNIYGWKSDIYNIDGIYISTGYGPVGKSIPYKVYKKYNEWLGENYRNLPKQNLKDFEEMFGDTRLDNYF